MPLLDFPFARFQPPYCLFVVVRGKGILFDFILILLLATTGAMFNPNFLSTFSLSVAVTRRNDPL